MKFLISNVKFLIIIVVAIAIGLIVYLVSNKFPSRISIPSSTDNTPVEQQLKEGGRGGTAAEPPPQF